MTFDKESVIYSALIEPNRLLVLVNAIGGALILLMAVTSAFTAITIPLVFTPAFSAGYGRGFSFFVLAFERQFGLGARSPQTAFTQLFILVVVIIIFLAAYIRFAFKAAGLGLSQMVKTFIQMRGRGLPDGAPVSLPEYSALGKILRRERYWNDIPPEHMMIGLFGLNAQRMSPVSTKIAKIIWPSFWKWLSDFSIAAMVAALLSALIIWAQLINASSLPVVPSVVALVRSAGAWPSLNQVLSPYAEFVVLIMVLRALDFTMLNMVVPKRDWSADCLTKRDRVVVPTSPYLVSEEFPQRMQKYRLSEKPNRVSRQRGEVAATSVGETGNFEFEGLIEQQPQAIKNPNERAALFWLISGWSLIIVGLGVLLFFLMPSDYRAAIAMNRLPEAVFTLMPVTQLIYIYVGRYTFLRGCAMVKQAEVIFNSCWFVAPAVAFQIRGTTSRAEVKVGRGRANSIETSSIVYRTEFLYELTSAMLLSEAESTGGHRDVISMWNTSESGVFLDAAVEEMTEIVGRRAAPINVDLSSEGLRDHLEANAVIDAIRARQTEAIRKETRTDPAAKSKDISPPKN